MAELNPRRQPLVPLLRADGMTIPSYAGLPASCCRTSLAAIRAAVTGTIQAVTHLPAVTHRR